MKMDLKDMRFSDGPGTKIILFWITHPTIIHVHGNFSVRGSGRKICGGDSNVQSIIREGNFFLFFPNF